MPTKPTTLGQRLRTARLTAGLTQVELAEKLAVNQSAISALESGREPEADTLRRLCRALGCTSDFLLGLER